MRPTVVQSPRWPWTSVMVKRAGRLQTVLSVLRRFCRTILDHRVVIKVSFSLATSSDQRVTRWIERVRSPLVTGGRDRGDVAPCVVRFAGEG